MSLNPATIKKMRGEQVFEFIRTQLALRAAQARGLEDVVRPGAPDPAQMRFILAAEAAVDVMTAIIAEGQDNRLRRANPPAWARAEREKARWEELRAETDRLIKVLADQARASLIVWTEEPPGDGEAMEDADDDGSHGVGEGDRVGAARVVGTT